MSQRPRPEACQGVGSQLKNKLENYGRRRNEKRSLDFAEGESIRGSGNLQVLGEPRGKMPGLGGEE